MPRQPSRLFAAVADRQTSWIDRLPERLRDYAVLARWDRPIGTWLLLLPCWWGMALAPVLPDPLLLVLFAWGAVCLRGAGCTVNDLADRTFDQKVARTRHRPLAAGRLGASAAVLFILIQMAAGALVLLAMPLTAGIIAIASLPLIVAYPFMKRVTWWPQAFLGITFNWGVLVGFAAVTGSLAPETLALYAAGIAWTLGYDTIYAHQDKEDDALIGVRSTARLFGAATPYWLVGFYAVMLALLATAGSLAGKSWLFHLCLVPVAWLLFRQVWNLRLDDPSHCLAQFRAHRDVGLLVTAALVAGSLPL